MDRKYDGSNNRQLNARCSYYNVYLCRRTTDGSIVYYINMSVHHLKEAVVSVVKVWCVIKEHSENKFTSKII